MKRSIAKYISVCVVLFLVFFGCKKSNHDTLVLLGDEHYIKSIDDIYPRKYRFQWPDIDETGYYTLEIIPKDTIRDTIWDNNHHTIIEIVTTIINDTLLIPPLSDFIFPPDLVGKYFLEADFGGGNDSIVNNLGQIVPYTHYQQNQNITFEITNQRNGLGRLHYIEAYPDPHIPAFEIDIDSAFIHGNGADSTFTICFDMIESYYDDENYQYGVIITGKLHSGPYKIIDGQDTIIYEYGGVSDMKKWKLFKGGGHGFVVGGQHYYYGRFAGRVE